MFESTTPWFWDAGRALIVAVPQTALELNGVLNSCWKQCLFHHDFLVRPGSGSGSGACLPSCLFFLCSKKESVPS